MLCSKPRGYFQIRRSGGGLGPHVKFGGKIWGKVRPSSPNKRKNLGSSVTTRRKSWEKVPILGSYLKFRGQNLGYLSFILLEAKFGAPTRISEAKFGANLSLLMTDGCIRIFFFAVLVSTILQYLKIS